MYYFFFISPKKINKIIPHIKNNFTGRKILICREISKYYEEYKRCLVDELNEFENEPKGELTIVISEKKNIKNTSQFLSESDKNIIKKMIKKLIKKLPKLWVRLVLLQKKQIYNYCLSLKNEK